MTRPAVLITLLEVPPEADAAFLAGWEREGGDSALYRALRPDVEFRFVHLARTASSHAFPARELSFAAHPGRYGVEREDGAPDTEGGVALINPFEVPDGEDDRFLAGWDRARDTLARQQGYLGTRLHRSSGPADFRFVDVARWSSPLMVARALERPEFREVAQAMPFASHPALYQAVRD